MSKEKNKKELAKEITQTMQESEQLKKLEEMIKNNIIEFPLDDVKYRVRKPTLAEAEEVRKIKNKRYQELLNSDDYLFQEQLIAKLEKKGKSISKMMEQMIKIQEDIEKLQLKLAEYGKEKEENVKFITELKTKIFELMEEKNSISLTKADYLSSSIEAELFQLENTYTAYLVLEKLDKKVEKDEHTTTNTNKWVRVFKNFKEFSDCKNNRLMTACGNYFGLILFSREE